MKTKVFISCGQNEKDDRELRISKEIGKIVSSHGYEPYLAIQKQDGKSFRENIFKELTESEYFLFVDLRREKIVSVGGDELGMRGSLFCHQELAIASFLDIEPAYFHETGVERAGLGKYIQSNSELFKTEEELFRKIKKFLATSKWKTGWKNALSMSVDPNTPSVPGITNGELKSSAWYHILIHNHHRTKHAHSCFAFLESYLDKQTGKLHHPKTVELHWAGCNIPGVTILPQSSRPLDALTIFQEMPEQLIVYSYSTSTQFHPAVLTVGEYELSYRVVSDNFPEVRETFLLNFKGGLRGANIKLKAAPAILQPKLGSISMAGANATIAPPLPQVRMLSPKKEGEPK